MDKRKFLYYNIHSIDNDKRIILSNYIDEHNIDHNENSNGILLNFSQLDDKHIDFFYNLYNLENKYPQYDTIEIKIPHKGKNPRKKILEYKDYELNSLEKLILSYSTN